MSREVCAGPCQDLLWQSELGEQPSDDGRCEPRSKGKLKPAGEPRGWIHARGTRGGAEHRIRASPWAAARPRLRGAHHIKRTDRVLGIHH